MEERREKREKYNIRKTQIEWAILTKVCKQSKYWSNK
jgi:hypothetical protein